MFEIIDVIKTALAALCVMACSAAPEPVEKPLAAPQAYHVGELAGDGVADLIPVGTLR